MQALSRWGKDAISKRPSAQMRKNDNDNEETCQPITKPSRTHKHQ